MKRILHNQSYEPSLWKDYNDTSALCKIARVGKRIMAVLSGNAQKIVPVNFHDNKRVSDDIKKQEIYSEKKLLTEKKPIYAEFEVPIGGSIYLDSYKKTDGTYGWKQVFLSDNK